MLGQRAPLNPYYLIDTIDVKITAGHGAVFHRLKIAHAVSVNDSNLMSIHRRHCEVFNLCYCCCGWIAEFEKCKNADS